MDTILKLPDLLSRKGLDLLRENLAVSLWPYSPKAAIAIVAAGLEADLSQRAVVARFKDLDSLLAVRRFTSAVAKVLESENVKKLLLTSGGSVFEVSHRQSCRSFRSCLMQTPIIARPTDCGLIVDEMRLDLPLLRVLMELLEHPEWKCGLVDAATERQLMLTESAADIVLGPEAPALTQAETQRRLQAATQLSRRDYFYLPDLEVFNQQMRAIEPNNPSSTATLRWRGCRRDGQWVYYTHQYRLIRDGLGNLYQLGKSIDLEEVNAPEPVPA